MSRVAINSDMFQVFSLYVQFVDHDILEELITLV